jgi:hypothetical protein
MVSLSALNLDTVEADLVKVEEIVALVAKYENYLPLPASVGVAVADLQKALQFAVSVLSDL